MKIQKTPEVRSNFDELEERVWQLLSQDLTVDLDRLKRENPRDAKRLPAMLVEVQRCVEVFRDFHHAIEESIDRGHAISLEEWIQKSPKIATKLREHWRNCALMAKIGEPSLFELRDSNRYEIGELVGHGGMGAVVMAKDRHLDREAVLKVPLKNVAKNPMQLERHEREAKIAGKLQHPNILPVFERGLLEAKSGESVPFFSMPFLRGSSLSDLLQSKADLREKQFEYVLYFRQVCQAMAYAHSKGIINRDLKPQNVMIGTFGDAYVIDWGFAKELRENNGRSWEASDIVTPDVLEAEVTTTWLSSSQESRTTAIGTWLYMPPEVLLEGEFNDKRLDVFCLGGILAYILTGQPVYLGGGLEIERQIRQGDLSGVQSRLDRCGAPLPLIQIAKRCLSLEMSKRPADAQVLAEEVSSYVKQTQAARVTAEKRLRWVTMAVAGVLLIALAIGMTLRQQAMLLARKNELQKAGEFDLRTGDLDGAAANFQRAIELGEARPSVVLGKLRAEFTKRTFAELTLEAEELAKLPLEKKDRAEVEMVLGDLYASQPERSNKGREILEKVVNSEWLTMEDKLYVEAVLALDIRETEAKLRSLLERQPFHHRGNLLLVATLFARGKITEARHRAELVQLTFPREVLLARFEAACNAVITETADWSRFEQPFRERFMDLLGANQVDLHGESVPGMEHLTFRRQALVAGRIARVIEAMPSVDVAHGLPVAPFERRSQFWREVQQLAEKLAPPDSNSLPGLMGQFLEGMGVKLVDRQAILAKLKALLQEEQDGLAIQMLAAGQFVEAAGMYGRLPNEEILERLREIGRLETASIEAETLAPRGQFEFASRALRVICDSQTASTHDDPFVRDRRRMLDDTRYIFKLGSRYPQMIDNIGILMIEVVLPRNGSKVETHDTMQLSHGMEVLNDWIYVSPNHVGARLHRGVLLANLGEWDSAILDIDHVLSVERTCKEAKELKRAFESRKLSWP